MSMKTAISIPDEIFEDAERLARRLKQSRSEVYSRAIAEYLARHAPDQITEKMDQALNELDEPSNEFVSTAAHRALRRTEW